MKLRIFLGFTILAAAGHAQIVPGSTGHGQPTFNCAVNDTYGDIDTNLVWKCYTAPNGWAPTPYFQPYGGSASGTFKIPSLISSVQPVYSVLGYGAVGNGSTNDTAAIAAAATACGTTGGILFFPRTPGGAFTTTQPVIPPGNCDIQIDGTLKATAAMSAVLNIGGIGRAQKMHLFGKGVIDSNNLASRHIWMTNYNIYEITGVTLANGAAIAGIDLGVTGAQSQAGAYIHDMNLFVPVGTAKVSGSVGIWEDTGTDASVGPNINVVGYDTCVLDSVGGNMPFNGIHCYGSSANNLPTTCFDSAHGNAQWLNMECDTPVAIGLRARQFNDQIVNFRCFNNAAFGNDNLVNCIQFDQTNPFSSVAFSIFKAEDASHRIAADVSAINPALLTTVGNYDAANVVIQNAIATNFKVISVTQTQMLLSSSADTNYALSLDSGATAAQSSLIVFRDRGSPKWDLAKDSVNAFQFFDVVQNANRFRIQSNGNMDFTNNAANPFSFNGGILQANAGLRVGTTGSFISNMWKGSGTLTYTAITAPGCQEQPLTVSNALAGDLCSASTGATDIGLTFYYGGCRVSATSTAQVKVCATATGTPTATTWTGWVTH